MHCREDTDPCNDNDPMHDTLSTEQATPTAPASAAEPMYLHLSVTDPETLAALAETPDGRERKELARTAIRIGLLSMKAARGTVDGTTIRHESERLLGTLDERLSKHRELMDEGVNGALSKRPSSSLRHR